jgi:hypothetical protein
MTTATKKMCGEAELILGLMQLTKKRDRLCGGTWVWGKVGAHVSFEALVFPETSPEGYDLDGSRISKLSIRHRGEVTACYDRGWDRMAKLPFDRCLVDCLCAGLAESVFGH